MADISPLHALHYDLDRTGGLAPVAAPPYDVIDAAAARGAGRPLAATTSSRSTCRRPAGGDPYAHAAAHARAPGATRASSSHDDEPALWALEQDYTGPDGRRRTRHGLFARVRVEDYGPGRIRPHERTHPGPEGGPAAAHARDAREPLADLLALRRRRLDARSRRTWPASRSTRASPTRTAPRTGSGASPTRTRSRPRSAALAPAELLIADGHHRYETARVYAQEIGGDGRHRHVLMCLVSLGDPGLTIFPTHRLLTGLDDARRVALRDAIQRDWDVEEVAETALEPEPAADGRVRIGYLDAHHGRAAAAHAQGPGDRRRGAARQARRLPPARHRGDRGAAAPGRARA